ncbi:coadhesin-like isoform X3 [Dreissena polymorpha]|uniref:coadhesin-like isoform X3 n=1 Tax=Dreissena polymorpha TaxID=45954 RepID=UPI002264CCF9|nr:coadhesin-like isoform X3 [Dreissena polymorpha]
MSVGIRLSAGRMSSECPSRQKPIKGLLFIMVIGLRIGGVCTFLDFTGLWSSWGEWSACSKSCDSGVRFRARHCMTGSTCSSNDDLLQQEMCQTRPCAENIDGSWSDWAHWGECSVSCDLGYKQRIRSCDNPAPQGSGHGCQGSGREFDSCSAGACQSAIDGGWTDFVDSHCSTTCGPGVLVSTRTCTNPAPQNGGKNCEGEKLAFRKCEIRECTVDGAWGAWSFFSPCAVICGSGYRHRTRSCSNPPPSGEGKDCQGAAVERLDCSSAACPPDIKVCDKASLLGAVTKSTSCSTLASTSSALDTLVIETYCSATNDTTKWKLGIEIHNNCDLIPLYTPIGVVRAGTAHVLQYGVLVECYVNNLQMATKNCHDDVFIENHALDDKTRTYHMILFEN